MLEHHRVLALFSITGMIAARVRGLLASPVIDSHGELQGIVSMNDVVLHAEHAHGKKAPDLTYDDVVNTCKAMCAHRHPKVGTEALEAAAI